MKKLAQISFSLLMAFSISLGYAGVPVYKMICAEDGHIQVSLTRDDAACHHARRTKSCCTPKAAKEQHQEPKGCCDYTNAFFQLEEISPVVEQQNTTGHILSAVAVLFPPYAIQQYLAATSDSHILHAPPLITCKQSQQSITQVFRI